MRALGKRGTEVLSPTRRARKGRTRWSVSLLVAVSAALRTSANTLLRPRCWRTGLVLVLAAFLARESLAQEAHDEHHRSPPAVRQSPPEHVPPEPPQSALPAMSNERMIELMGMDDNAPRTMLAFDQLEWREARDRDILAWDAQGWFGNDYDKAWWKSEGEYIDDTYKARHELLWDRIASRWWSFQAGVRHDVGEGPSRTWAAIGVQGLAPYWFEIEATAYLGEEGRTAARASLEYELLVTQRLILRPELELEAYGKDDPANLIGSGFASIGFGLRLRYEIRRELAPYIGVQWERKVGNTEDLVLAAGQDANDAMVVAGVRVWF